MKPLERVGRATRFEGTDRVPVIAQVFGHAAGLVGKSLREYARSGPERRRSRRDAGPMTKTIMVVEDEELVRSLMCRILRHDGYRILQARDGVEAVRKAEALEGPIHLLVTDVVMPRMNGAELALRFAEIRPETEVLYVSGYPKNVVAQHGVIDPDMRLLMKPFQRDELLSAVRAAIGEDPAT